MEHQVGPVQGTRARLRIADVAFVEVEARRLRRRDRGEDFRQVPRAAGGEVVEPDHALIECQKALDEIGPDETGATRHHPAAGFIAKAPQQGLVWGRPAHATSAYRRA